MRAVATKRRGIAATRNESKVTTMQVVKEGPALEARAQAGVGGVAWQVVRVAAGYPAAPAAQPAPRVGRVRQAAQDQPGAAEVRPLQVPPGSAGVRRVEAVVLLAVAAYFVAGLVGALVA